MDTVEQKHAINIVGLELRTSNEQAFEQIPGHWQKFFVDGILERIPNKVSNDVFAVYTNFANPGQNNDGTYSLIIGAEVDNLDAVPDDLVGTVIPGSRRKVFHVAQGHPEQVGAKWQEIWGTQLDKAFVSDYEHYRASGEIAIHIGVR
jgi:predicted transcriptional regulator YdeE